MPNLLIYTLLCGALTLPFIISSSHAKSVTTSSKAELTDTVRDWLELSKIISSEKAKFQKFEDLREQLFYSKSKNPPIKILNEYSEKMYFQVIQKRSALKLLTANSKKINNLMIEKIKIEAKLQPKVFFTAYGLESNQRLNALNKSYKDEFNKLETLALADLKNSVGHTGNWINEWLTYKLIIIDIDKITSEKVEKFNSISSTKNDLTEDNIQFLNELSKIEKNKLSEIKPQSPEIIQLLSYKQQYFKAQKILNLNVINPDSQNSIIYSDDFETLGQINVKMEFLESTLDHKLFDYLDRNFISY